MPKEIIPSSEGVTGTSENPFELAAKVVWGRGTYVQIATSNLVEMSHQAKLEQLDTLGDGWYVDLDRSGINKLIKVLRRARDQAFGADE